MSDEIDNMDSWFFASFSDGCNALTWTRSESSDCFGNISVNIFLPMSLSIIDYSILTYIIELLGT